MEVPLIGSVNGLKKPWSVSVRDSWLKLKFSWDFKGSWMFLLKYSKQFIKVSKRSPYLSKLNWAESITLLRPFILSSWILTKGSSETNVKNQAFQFQDFKTDLISFSKPIMQSNKCKFNLQKCNLNSKKLPLKLISSWPSSLLIKPKQKKCKKLSLLNKKSPTNKKPRLPNLQERLKPQSLKQTQVCKLLWLKLKNSKRIIWMKSKLWQIPQWLSRL
jgi:hypothetical protein